MQWPTKPTCHSVDPVFAYGDPEWRAPETPTSRADGGPFRPFRTCSYCGSVHPEDLYNAFVNLRPVELPTLESFTSKLDPTSPTLAEDWQRATRAHALARNVPKMGGSDWKYGWPHKFYVDLPLPSELQGVMVITGRSYGPGGEDVSKRTMSPMGPTVGAKWYNDHLSDKGYDDEALTALTALLEKHAGIAFFLENGKLMYRAPHSGYQR